MSVGLSAHQSAKRCGVKIQRPRLLIIEDDLEFRDSLVNLLRDEFFISVADEGCEGYSRAISSRPDIVTLDTRMPGWDAVRTLTAFRENPRLQDIPILIVSDDSSRESVLPTIQAGADGYLLKENCSKANLIDRLNALLDVHVRS